jgi:hypothetical protein
MAITPLSHTAVIEIFLNHCAESWGIGVVFSPLSCDAWRGLSPTQQGTVPRMGIRILHTHPASVAVNASKSSLSP